MYFIYNINIYKKGKKNLNNNLIYNFYLLIYQ